MPELEATSSDKDSALLHVRNPATMLFSTKGTTVLCSIAAVCLLIFLCVASALFGTNQLVPFDEDIIRAVRHGATPQTTLVAMYITFLGSEEMITAAATAFVVVLLMRRKFLTAAFVFSCSALSALLMAVAKISYMRNRPDSFDAFVLESGFSFPSGHATVTTSFYGGLLFLLLSTQLKSAWQQVLALIAYILLVLAVAWSRVYLGVHYPSDIVGGLCLGTCWWCISVAMFGVFLRRQKSSTTPVLPVSS